MEWNEVRTENSRIWIPSEAPKVLDALASIRPDLRETLEAFSDRGIALINFLTVSPVSLTKILKRPELLEWLAHSDVQRPRDTSSRSQRKAVTKDDLFFQELRAWKSAEMLRIAYREITGLATFPETTRDITSVAECCVSEVYRTCLNALGEKWGKPDTGFGILAMGKFGGTELNYSSDIDVIFFYDQDGYINPRFTHHEFYARLAEKIIEIFSASGCEPLFRIDVRLRPEGTSGPLASSFASLENYYAGYGETWERMALIKARGVCGDGELLYEFNQRLQPFIFPRTVSGDLLDEIADLKGRIERDLVGAEDLHRNVKLGYGGIREIEFIVQTLQLLHGARNAFLQERNTLKALAAIEQLDLLPSDQVSRLRDAYVFLRGVEHRLQIEHERQTHTLPARQEQWNGVANAMGYADVDAFARALETHTVSVRSTFHRLLRRRLNEVDHVKSALAAFEDPDGAAKSLTTLRAGSSSRVHVAPRTRRLYVKLEPELLRWCSNVADPDAALRRFIRFVDAYGIRGLLFETLLANPKLLELLIRLFDASPLFSDVVIRRPQLIEEIARGRNLGVSATKAQFLQGLDRREEDLPVLDWIRVYRRAEAGRILLRDILNTGSQEELQLEMTALAEACLEYCSRQIHGAEELTIIALGKFGGRELLYGADLDVVFIGETPTAAGALIEAMATKTAEGRIFPLDTRLRPEGENGPLVVTRSTYETYFAGRAQFWETQALTKARLLCGPEKEAVTKTIEAIWSRACEKPELNQHIYKMYERIVKERGKGEGQFKAGRGGLIAIEFIVQSLQMRNKIKETNTRNAISKLENVLTEGESTSLKTGYDFFRRVESVLRRADNRSISELPSNEIEQNRLALRMGFPSRTEFLESYNVHCAAVEEIVQRRLK
jgi:[glutamine synthetase] adenylyltransferase / [glutamine synthetase]-adenylyl-L-tyrosine phosphorylase